MKRIFYILLLLMLVCVSVSATLTNETTIDENGGTVIVLSDSPEDTIANPTTRNTTPQSIGRRIEQGACVMPGETIDIAGLGWYTGQISYYGRYFDDYAEPGNSSVVSMYDVKSTELKHLYLDPDFFENKLGYWYTKYNVYGRSGNDRLFKVALSCIPTNKEKETLAAEANLTKIAESIIQNKTMLPVKIEGGANYIFSRPSVTSLEAPANVSTRWIFGRNTPDKFYDTPIVNGVNTFDMQDLEPGTYTIVYIGAGKNGILEETYDREKKAIVSPFKGTMDTSLYGIQPRVAETLLEIAIKNSKDDTYFTETMVVQDPSIEIIKLTQDIATVGKTNISVFTISGYTNAHQNTILNIQMDQSERVYGRLATAPHIATAINNGGQVAYRAWSKYFLLDTGAMRQGQHSFTVTNNEGATATVPFYVYREPPSHHVDNATITYIGNNPFIPTPTPVIIERQIVVTQTIIQRITVPVTPSQESVDAASMKAMESVIALVLAGIVSVVIIGYMVVTVARVMLRRKI